VQLLDADKPVLGQNDPIGHVASADRPVVGQKLPKLQFTTALKPKINKQKTQEETIQNQIYRTLSEANGDPQPMPPTTTNLFAGTCCLSSKQ
jgi:hypothetical protein